MCYSLWVSDCVSVIINLLLCIPGHVHFIIVQQQKQHCITYVVLVWNMSLQEISIMNGIMWRSIIGILQSIRFVCSVSSQFEVDCPYLVEPTLFAITFFSFLVVNWWMERSILALGEIYWFQMSILTNSTFPSFLPTSSYFIPCHLKHTNIPFFNWRQQ